MRDFTGRGNVLRRLDPGARLVYGGFLLFMLAGLTSAALLHADSMGASVASAAAYWRGDEAAMIYPKSSRQVLELTHFHLFTEPVVWLVVAHLYHLSGGRGWVSLGTLLAIGLQIALPWLVTGGAGAALLLPATAAVTLGLVWMSLASLREMVAPRSS
jgi:hypothetical protein